MAAQGASASPEDCSTTPGLPPAPRPRFGRRSTFTGRPSTDDNGGTGLRHDCSYDPIIDQMVPVPSNDVRELAARPPHAAPSTHPPTPVEGREAVENESAAASIRPSRLPPTPQDGGLCSGARPEAERRPPRRKDSRPSFGSTPSRQSRYGRRHSRGSSRRAAPTPPTVCTCKPIRGVLASAGCRVGPTSVEFHDALRAGNFNGRQRSVTPCSSMRPPSRRSSTTARWSLSLGDVASEPPRV